jgi:catechol 2,3-dioxygenase-like lactoylglutathione lyase family enzyme
MAMDIETLHHVSLPVSDLERAKAFYGGIIGLVEIERPPFNFPGAWFRAGDRDVHLIVGTRSTFRDGKGIDSRDAHLAIRVRSYRRAVAHLEALGYTEAEPHASGGDPFRTMRISPRSTAGFPQIYILDPDRNVVEINAAVDDRTSVVE